MRKILLFTLILSFTTVWLIACGGSNGNGGGGNPQPSISISPTSASVLVGQAANFSANVQNVSDTRVSWSVQEANGGTITATSTGAIYTAPWPVGTYHVVVTSVAQPSLTATATLSVSAKFAFIEEYPSGDALPFSMTPMLGTYGPNGILTISGVTDQGTGNPVSVAMQSLTLSNDGKKAAFDMLMPAGDYYTSDIYTANPDGTGTPAQLTTDGYSSLPQFSADGQQIVYIKGYDIWAMNMNGSNQHVVFSSSANYADAWSATLSLDGTKIAAELLWYPGDGSYYYDGIAIMNADGSNAVPLTGGPDMSCFGYDEMPSFTHDGTKVMFSRFCVDPYTFDFVESLYTINADGTNLTQLSSANWGVAHYNPLAVADKIVFQTNQDSPYTYGFEIYSMKADGSAVTRLTNNSAFDGFDTWWSPWSNYWPSSAISQQASRGITGKAPYGAAARAEKIKNLQQHRK